MELVRTDPSGAWLGVVESYSLDMAIGADENDFQLTVPASLEIEPGSFVFAPFTEWGGIVDSRLFSNAGETPTVAYSGRTWQGMLEKSVLKPNRGADYLDMSGDANAIIRAVIQRQGLNAVFEVEPDIGVQFSHRFNRYVDAFTGLSTMLERHGLRLDFSMGDTKCVLGAKPITRYVDDGFDDLHFTFELFNDDRPVNHIVALGQGELAARTVIDLYADQFGNVSRTQTQFGPYEVTEVYENTNADADELEEGATKRLVEAFKAASTIDFDLPSGREYMIGDVIGAVSTDTGISIEATVTKKILNVGEDGFPYINYEVGNVTASNAFSGR